MGYFHLVSSLLSTKAVTPALQANSLVNITCFGFHFITLPPFLLDLCLPTVSLELVTVRQGYFSQTFSSDLRHSLGGQFVKFERNFSFGTLLASRYIFRRTIRFVKLFWQHS